MREAKRQCWRGVVLSDEAIHTLYQFQFLAEGQEASDDEFSAALNRALLKLRDHEFSSRVTRMALSPGYAAGER